ncbi:hypothetical protein Syun_001276 [Stephania yunnanensis]|uniref:WDR11 second beta-propeller domain-containing protein n=1 Tax=Stephania yunnanensis TaxID=152371 RepID=A0AAP0QAR1_9MAGN
MKDCYMIVSLIAVIDVSAHAVAASFYVHNGIIKGFRWLSNSRPVSFSYTQKEMQKFTAKIVDMMKQEKLYASQGGPIILFQEEGWPLGLQPLNMRVGLVRTCDFYGSISSNTLITGSPSSSTDSSSDLDTEQQRRMRRVDLYILPPAEKRKSESSRDLQHPQGVVGGGAGDGVGPMGHLGYFNKYPSYYKIRVLRNYWQDTGCEEAGLAYKLCVEFDLNNDDGVNADYGLAEAIGSTEVVGSIDAMGSIKDNGYAAIDVYGNNRV